MQIANEGLESPLTEEPCFSATLNVLKQSSHLNLCPPPCMKPWSFSNSIMAKSPINHINHYRFVLWPSLVSQIVQCVFWPAAK